MKLFRILKTPVQTEKTAQLEMKNNTYVFIVSSDATKIDIKKSISVIYGVEVEKVNIVHTREKFKFWKKRGLQLRKRWEKKAYITLKDDKAKIDFSVIK